MTRPPLPRPLLYAAAIAGALVLATFATWLQQGWGGPRGAQVLSDVALVVVPMLAAAGCVLAASRARGARRWGWGLMGASAYAWSLGQTVWSAYELGVGREVPFPSLADVGYLGAVPLAAAGMLLLASGSATSAERVRALMDGIIIALALLCVSWILVLGPVARASAGTTLQQSIALAYPLGDVVIGTLAFYVVAHAPRADRAPAILVALAALALAVADSGFAYLTTTGAYQTGNVIDIGWLAGYVLIGIAALEVATRAPAAPRGPEPPSLRSAMVPYIPFGLVLIVGAASIPTGAIDPFVLWNGFFLVLFVASRQLLHIVDHLELAQRHADANEELRRVQSFRAQLLNNVSHDLATPLTPVVLQLRILEMDASTDRTRRSLEIVRRNVEQLQRLVGDVKDVARLQGGGLRLEPKPVELGALVRGAVDCFQKDAEARGVTLEARIEGELPVHADPQRLTQVAFNLLTNALKFTPEGGRVTVIAEQADGLARVRVRDTGRGLLPQERNLLFQPFSQVHEVGETKEKGTGLGLFISRGIVEQHGGRLDVESEGRGRGATFWLAIPMLSPGGSRA